MGLTGVATYACSVTPSAVSYFVLVNLVAGKVCAHAERKMIRRKKNRARIGVKMQQQQQPHLVSQQPYCRVLQNGFGFGESAGAALVSSTETCIVVVESTCDIVRWE